MQRWSRAHTTLSGALRSPSTPPQWCEPDFISVATAVAVLAAAGTLAAWIPARRAARVDPILALRYE
jgi:hypothetical protein